jgi:4-amino-4-deoxychorismate lyase
VLEAPTGSVVWARGHSLATTPTGPSGILAGTTQQLLFERAADAGWQTDIRALRADQLGDVDSLWLVGSLRGPVDVVRIDGRDRAADVAVTAQIQQLAGF